MGDSRYKRVSRRHPCLICGKPDWCSRTANDSISFCARVCEGADRLSRKERWGVFYHDRTLVNQPIWKLQEPHNFYNRRPEEITLAPIEIRDFVYSTLVRLSPASNYQCLTTGTKGLSGRGLENFEDYGGLPCSVSERKEIAARLRLLLNQNFPAYLRENPHGIRHIPGFWVDAGGEVNLWQDRDFPHPFLLVPYRNPAGKIQACQIRFTGALKVNKKRYFWLSLPAMNSAGSGTPLHYAGWKNFGRKNFYGLPVLVTEGALKADTVARLRPEYFAVANGGVNCSQELIVNVSRGKTLYLAFDGDYRENPAVARGLARLLKLRLDDNRNYQSSAATKILVWTRDAKGVDDALLKGEKLDKITILDWFSALTGECREEARKVWAE